RRELGVDDGDVLEAIRVHTVGSPGMGSLALVLYVADKIEPARDYPSVERLRGLSGEDLREAAAESLRRSIAHNKERGRSVHPASRETLEWLEAEHTSQGRVEQE
ncbi:MAG TPA: bis(5'-nucleosyl)-tetraphosphatase (symmetrical) YqeK, partial [Rubrobacter sp.]|nr:bis(5'-nucleosyl)-tetraphosphatase (symmetrical) YqeK [Rubrobacter sp.]